jgi:hypothetical protein
MSEDRIGVPISQHLESPPPAVLVFGRTSPRTAPSASALSRSGPSAGANS